MATASIPPRDIDSFLQIQSTSSPNVLRQDIYNYIAEGRRGLAKGQSQMHALVNGLDDEGFWSRIKLDNSNRVAYMMFARPKSLEYLKAYLDIVTLDCIYKTN
jgi:hypothetical protein